MRWSGRAPLPQGWTNQLTGVQALAALRAEGVTRIRLLGRPIVAVRVQALPLRFRPFCNGPSAAWSHHGRQDMAGCNDWPIGGPNGFGWWNVHGRSPGATAAPGSSARRIVRPFHEAPSALAANSQDEPTQTLQFIELWVVIACSDAACSRLFGSGRCLPGSGHTTRPVPMFILRTACACKGTAVPAVPGQSGCTGAQMRDFPTKGGESLHPPLPNIHVVKGLMNDHFDIAESQLGVIIAKPLNGLRH